MSAFRAEEEPGGRAASLRLGRLDAARLAWAFGISLAIHLLCFGGYELFKRIHIVLPPWMQRVKVLAALAPQPKRSPPAVPRPSEPPLVFVEVNPETATATPPKNAKFYSNRNSVAANRQADRDTGAPRINGTQTHVPKTETAQRSQFDRLQPVFKPAPRPQSEERARPKPPPGDLAMAKPQAPLHPENGTAEHTRPRTIQEALARRGYRQMPGQQMKQDGGVRRLHIQPSFDTKATPFGEYDAKLIEAIQSRWYHLLDQISYEGYRHGKVVLQFHLNYDGRITDMKVVDQNVGDMLTYLCQAAVSEPAPYDPWPREMRLMIAKDYREITFTFFYD